MKNYAILGWLSVGTAILAAIEYPLGCVFAWNEWELVGCAVFFIIGLIPCAFFCRIQETLGVIIGGVVISAATMIAVDAVQLVPLLTSTFAADSTLLLVLVIAAGVYIPVVYAAAIWLYLRKICRLDRFFSA